MSRVLTLLLASFPKLTKLFLVLQVSSPPLFLPSSMPLVSWGWLQAWSSSILGFFKSHLFHRILWAIQNEIMQAFHLPFNWIVWNPTNKLTWFLFLLLPCWCLRYIWKGHSVKLKFFVHFKRFMASDSSSLQKSSCASYVARSHHWWEDSSTIPFHRCLLLRGTGGYSYIAKTLKTFDSNYCFKRHHCCHVLITPPLLDLVPQPIFYYQPKHTVVLNRFLFAKAFTTTPHLSLGGFF
jgi:hypothetical protein